MSELVGQFAGDVHALLERRLAEAAITDVLSDRNDQMLTLRKEPNGKEFVLREYPPMALDQYEYDPRNGELSFEEAWDAMHSMYAAAGIRVVQSSILPHTREEKDTVGLRVVSEYLENITSLKRAPLAIKEGAVASLARLLSPKQSYMPNLAAMSSDLFFVTIDEHGKQAPIIVDVDPRINKIDPGVGRKDPFVDMLKGMHMEKVRSLIVDYWAISAEEEAALARAFLRELATLHDNPLDGPCALDALMELHSLTQEVRF